MLELLFTLLLLDSASLELLSALLLSTLDERALAFHVGLTESEVDVEIGIRGCI